MVAVGATLCGQREVVVKMRLTGVTRLPDSVWGTGCCCCFCHNLGNCSRPTLTGEGWGRGEGGGRSWKAWLQLQDNACCSAQPRPSLPAGGGWLAASKGHSRGRARPRVSPDLHTTHNPKFATAPSWEKCINQMRLLEESSVH